MASKPQSGYPIHQYAELFPLHDGQPLWDLRDDIKEHGQAEAIVLYKGQVLDGRRRQAAIIGVGETPDYTTFKGTDSEALAFVVSKNLKRRHLGEAERAMVAAKVAQLKRGDNQHTSKVGNNTREVSAPALTSQSEAAEMLNVSVDAVKKAKKIQDHGTPSLQSAVADGTVTLTDAAKVAKESPEVQDRAVASVESGKAKTAAAAVEREPGCDEPDEVPLLDSEGHVVPGALAEAFLAPFDEAVSLCQKLQSLIDTLACGPGGAQLARFVSPRRSGEKTIQRSKHLDDLKSDISGTRPHSICPFCAGKAKAGCKGCNGTGWVTKRTWEGASDSEKGRLAS